MKTFFRCFLGASLLLLLAACATVTETGRRQLLLVSDSEVTPMAISEFEKLKQGTPISKDVKVNEMLQRVGKRIAAVATLPNAQWEFVLFDDAKTVNAFCLPGGKVGVYTGILPITKDETGLATVIGHEVAHATAKHGAERMSGALATQLGGQLFGMALKNQSAQTQNLFLGIYGVTSQVGWTLPHSREQESEADHIGLLYMARAGYDPRAAVDFWKRFAAFNQKSGGQQWEFLSTHPLDETRIKDIEKRMPAALAEYQKAVPASSR
ncbi:MAG: Beta-barrel assembly-enhancing protease [Verrucomicrobiae bacterium]|nr:Beta-barrel assembly-enhancing protease [Verrucomicrobiae bacterium]